MIKIEDFIRTHGIMIKECNKIHQNPHMKDFKGDHWEVVLHTTRNGINELVTFFSKGFGHRGKRPTAIEVLDCLASDAMGYENSKNLENWAIEYGYDTDSRRAEKIYYLVKRESIDLKNFLGKEAYEQLLWETERM